MRCRAFKPKANSRFAEALMTTTGDAFDIPASKHLAAIPVALDAAVADNPG